jgi:hypothetical protein
MEDVRVRLSVLWVFATLNYLYADVIHLFYFVGSNQGAHGSAPHITQGVLLGVAILLEIPMAMTVMSRMLKPRANRWANMVAGTIETTAVLLTTIFLPTLCYLFFGAIEVACTSLIVWYAWSWPRETANPN